MAAECLALARPISDSGVRASLVEMAQKWLDLAELSEHDGWNEALRLRALEASIGRELRTLYELPHKLPHRHLALLMQLNAATGDLAHLARTIVQTLLWIDHNAPRQKHASRRATTRC
jgi:hypothetical protein